MTYVDGFVIPVPMGRKQPYNVMDDKADMPFDMKRIFLGGFETIVEGWSRVNQSTCPAATPLAQAHWKL